jgi:hypothetical protein
MIYADPIGREVQSVGLRPLASWNCGFESLRGHGCLSLESVVCCQVQVSATADPWSRGVLPSLCVFLTMQSPYNLERLRTRGDITKEKYNVLKGRFGAVV